MAKYECTFMTERLQNEMDELLKGEHAGAIIMYGYDCAAAGVKGYRAGRRQAIVTGVILGAVLLAGTKLVKHISKKCKEKKAAEELDQKDMS